MHRPDRPDWLVTGRAHGRAMDARTVPYGVSAPRHEAPIDPSPSVNGGTDVGCRAAAAHGSLVAFDLRGCLYRGDHSAQQNGGLDHAQ